MTVWDANDYSARLRCWQRGCEAALCVAGTPDILVSGYTDGKVPGHGGLFSCVGFHKKLEST